MSEDTLKKRDILFYFLIIMIYGIGDGRNQIKL